MFHGFLLAAELGSTRIGGNDLSSGIAGVNGQIDRVREKEVRRERKRESPIITNYCVKSLRWKLRFMTIQQFNGLVSFKTKGKKMFR